MRWLVEHQNPDGGWGAGLGTPSSVEETALALEALLGASGPDSSPLPLGEGGRRPGEGSQAYDASTQMLARSSHDSVQTATQTASPFDRIPHPGPLPEGEGIGQTAIRSAIAAGLSWLIARVEDGRYREPAPIGFYFAKLWYFERLYPLIFTVAALRQAVRMSGNDTAAAPANDGK
jgi:squalene-hopene/tetraprenyl-beta-curcumene cyclase